MITYERARALAGELKGEGLGECSDLGEGLLAVTTPKGSQILLRHDPGVGLVAATLVGRLPADEEKALLALRSFMGGHLLWIDSQGATFAYDEGSDCITIQCAYTNEEGSASELAGMIRELEQGAAASAGVLASITDEGEDARSQDQGSWRMA
ncbi:MAG: type III secretion system chaperone [Succinivibrionaceae bacterium]|nr:type III secretion system chaperone [Succinivibrionaceae bacterium]